MLHYVPPPSYFSFSVVTAELLVNGNIEVEFASTSTGAIVQELDPGHLQVVWQGRTPTAYQYHVNRLQSLYPGVQW